MPSIYEIAEKYKISLFYLFGSQAKLGEKYLYGEQINPASYSDLDIAVLFEEIPANIIKTYGELYKELCIIFEPFEIDLVFMHEQDSLFQYEIIKGYAFIQKMKILQMKMKSL